MREIRFTSANVLGLIPGSDPALADQPMLLMAHLDGLGIRAAAARRHARRTDQIRNGAMDNATGIATLIEVARQFMRDRKRPRRPILLAAVTAEEIGLVGAEYLAHNPVGGRVARGGQSRHAGADLSVQRRDRVRRRAFDAGPDRAPGGGADERRARRRSAAAGRAVHPLGPLQVRPRGRALGLPDDRLRRRGRERFTRFLADTYHSPRDDLSLPFDWQAGARFAQLNYLIAREIADSRRGAALVCGQLLRRCGGGRASRARSGRAEAQAAARRAAQSAWTRVAVVKRPPSSSRK